MAILEGKDPGKKIASTYTDTLKANWTVWPVVQTVNFKFVPLEGRVLFVNIVSLGESRELIYLFEQFGGRKMREIKTTHSLYLAVSRGCREFVY